MMWFILAAFVANTWLNVAAFRKYAEFRQRERLYAVRGMLASIFQVVLLYWLVQFFWVLLDGAHKLRRDFWRLVDDVNRKDDDL